MANTHDSTQTETNRAMFIILLSHTRTGERETAEGATSVASDLMSHDRQPVIDT